MAIKCALKMASAAVLTASRFLNSKMKRLAMMMSLPLSTPIAAQKRMMLLTAPSLMTRSSVIWGMIPYLALAGMMTLMAATVMTQLLAAKAMIPLQVDAGLMSLSLLQVMAATLSRTPDLSVKQIQLNSQITILPTLALSKTGKI